MGEGPVQEEERLIVLSALYILYITIFNKYVIWMCVVVVAHLL